MLPPCVKVSRKKWPPPANPHLVKLGMETFHISNKFCSFATMHNAIFYMMHLMQYSTLTLPVKLVEVKMCQRLNLRQQSSKICLKLFQIVLCRSGWEKLKARSGRQGEHDHHRHEGEDEGEGEGKAGGVWADQVGLNIWLDNLIKLWITIRKNTKNGIQ